MRRILVTAALLLAIPSVAEAQPRLLVGVGVTAPMSDLADNAETGYHLAAGLMVTIPTLPVGLRADGALHQLGSPSAALEDTQVLTGSLSVVFTLPGVGLQPYLLGGWGRYRIEAGPAGAPVQVTDPGFHGGFGVAIGGLGLGGYAEIRYINIDAAASTALFPLTVGIRL